MRHVQKYIMNISASSTKTVILEGKGIQLGAIIKKNRLVKNETV